MCPRAVKRLIILTLLTGSLAGCAAVVGDAPARPVAVPGGDCGSPARPVLPLVDGEASFDAPHNVSAIMTITDYLKGYAVDLESVIRCYEAQTAHLKALGAGVQ